MSTVSSLANFFAEKTVAGLGDWKVQLDLPVPQSRHGLLGEEVGQGRNSAHALLSTYTLNAQAANKVAGACPIARILAISVPLRLLPLAST